MNSTAHIQFQASQLSNFLVFWHKSSVDIEAELSK